MLFDLTDKLVWVAGQHGMVGGAMLEREPCALLLDPGRAAVDFSIQELLLVNTSNDAVNTGRGADRLIGADNKS
jgi:hypothetical protein